jgi:hypothetical protein
MRKRMPLQWAKTQNNLGNALATLGSREAGVGAEIEVGDITGKLDVLVNIYRRRCVVTHERTLPALEAAHIRPYGEGGEHEPSNGLLLRRDLHSLFDAGYVL